ncbi:unnamed protein product [Phaeothamnion confervicola]
MRKLSLCLLIGLLGSHSEGHAETFGGLPVPGGERVAIVHAEGAQVYECRRDLTNALSWQFREPVATLVDQGKTVGRHYVGPSWELADGTVITGKVVVQAPGATKADIPLLMLWVNTAKGHGLLAHARTVLRINTKGGVAAGACQNAGELLSVPYSADYAFFQAVRDN